MAALSSSQASFNLFTTAPRNVSKQQLGFLMEFYMAKEKTSDAKNRALGIVAHFELTEKQELYMVGVIKKYHEFVAERMAHNDKVVMFKYLGDAYQQTSPQTWMRSALSKLMKDWVKCNSPELDGNLREFCASLNTNSDSSASAAAAA